MGFHLPFFPMYAAETVADGRFQGWNLEERGAWITLLCYAWNDGDIPAAPSSLARLLGVDTGDMNRILSAIGSRFIPKPGEPSRLICPRLEQERDRALRLSKVRSEVGKKGADARWGNGNGMPLPSVCHSPGNAEAMPPRACPQQPKPPSQPPPQPASRLRRAGGVKLGPLADEAVQRVGEGLGHKLKPFLDQSDADEFEARIRKQGGVDAAVAEFAARAREWDEEPKAAKILLLWLRDAQPAEATA